MTLFPHAAMLAALALFPVAGIAVAAEVRKSGDATRDETTGTDGGLRAMLQLATAQEAARFREEWRSTAADHAPHLETIHRVHRGQPVAVLLFYGGCAPKGADAADVLARKVPCAARLDVRITAPAGRTQTAMNDESLSGGMPAAADAMTQLSPHELQITFDATDADGPYRIEATVDDPDNDRVLRIATTVELQPDAPAP
ncbi:MAG: hypothetical protein ACTHOH_09870 [Lysobacteraceae bacterium]